MPRTGTTRFQTRIPTSTHCLLTAQTTHASTHTHTYVHICTSHTIHANTYTHTHKVYFSINRIMCTSISTAMCTRPHAKLLHHMQSLTHFHMPVQASEASQTSSFLHSFSARHRHFHTLFTFTDFTLSCSIYVYTHGIGIFTKIKGHIIRK